MARIDAEVLESGQKLTAESVVAGNTEQDGRIAETRNSDGLVGSLAAGVQLKTGADDRFAGPGMRSVCETRSMLMLPTTTIGFMR